jgi:hypothetical protein
VVTFAFARTVTAQTEFVRNLPLVKLTGDVDFRVLAQETVIHDRPLVVYTGDAGVHAYVPERLIVGDMPLVALTGDPGSRHWQQPETMPQPLIVGNPELDSMQVVAEFTMRHDARFFADNAEIVDMSRAQRFVGHEAIRDVLATFYDKNHLFRESFEEPVRVVVPSDNLVICESVFRGTLLRRDGSLVKALRDPITVEIPMISVFEVENGQIARQQMYYDSAQLLGLLDLR